MSQSGEDGDVDMNFLAGETRAADENATDAFMIAPIRRTRQEIMEQGEKDLEEGDVKKSSATTTKRKATAVETAALFELLKPTSVSILAMIQGTTSTAAKDGSLSRKKARLSSDSLSSSSSLLTVTESIRLKWWDKVDTWISTSSWKKVLVLIGPSGSGKTFCVHSYLALKTGRTVRTLKPYAFCQRTMEQQLLTLLQDVPPQTASAVSSWILHIPYCHPLEMMRASDWKYLEGLFIHSHLSLRTTLPLVVIEARSSEFQTWHYSPLRKIWKQSLNAVDIVYTQGWTSKDFMTLSTTNTIAGHTPPHASVVTRCIERSQSDTRQFLLHLYLESFRPIPVQKQQHKYKSRLLLSTEKGMTPVLAELFKNPGVTMSELKAILRFFPLQDNLDYRFLDSCLAMVSPSPAASKSASGPSFPSMKTLYQYENERSSSALEESSEPSVRAVIITKSKTDSKQPPPKWIKAKVVSSRKHPTMKPVLNPANHHLEQLSSIHQWRRLQTLSKFYSIDKAFQFGLVPERWAFENTRSAIQLASLAMAHSIKWEWDNTGFQCKADNLWSEIGKRLSHVRLFMYANNEEG